MVGKLSETFSGCAEIWGSVSLVKLFVVALGFEGRESGWIGSWDQSVVQDKIVGVGGSIHARKGGGSGGFRPPPQIPKYPSQTLARLGASAKFWQKACF